MRRRERNSPIDSDVLDVLKKNAEEGDGFSVIFALRICLKHEEPVPDWLKAEFLSRAELVLRGDSSSWDEAFGKPWPHIHLSKLRRWKLEKSVVARKMNAQLARIPRPAIDDALFEKVGERVKAHVGRVFSKSKVKELWYSRSSPYSRASQFRKKAKKSGNTTDGARSNLHLAKSTRGANDRSS